MELLALGVVTVALYFLSDWTLNRLESMAGRRFEQRSVVFFAILLVSMLVSFSLIRTFSGG